MEAINYRPATAAQWAHKPMVLPPAGIDFGQAGGSAPLQVRILRTALERQAIARLRRHAAFGVENDLGLGLQPFEQTRDEVGLLMAVYRDDDRPIATLRLVPTGYGLTGAERLADKPDVQVDRSILGQGSWEVGRVIMEPEDRHPELLLECLSSMLDEVMQIEDVRHFHATATLPMARLWRRVGMRTVVNTAGASGTRYCLVHGRVQDVMTALQMPQPVAGRTGLVTPHRLASTPVAHARVTV